MNDHFRYRLLQTDTDISDFVIRTFIHSFIHSFIHLFVLPSVGYIVIL